MGHPGVLRYHEPEQDWTELSKPDGGDLALLRWACAVTSVIENGPQQPPSLTPRY